MKKILFLMVATCFGVANAQVKYGIKAGYNASNIVVTTPLTSAKIVLGTKSGFHAGGFVEYNVANNLFLQGEVLYNSLGTRIKYDINEIPKNFNGEPIFELDSNASALTKGKVTLNIHNITIPISLKYTFDRFSIFGGFGVNFVAGVKLKGEGTLGGKEIDLVDEFKKNTDMIEIDLDSEIKKQLTTNFSAHLGAEYMFTDNIFMDVRYNFGISSINKNYTDFARVRQRYFQVGVGYRF
ncbi:porin family protein [Capnocytophaga catalasegens]|uniref:Outer membrane protein beta-barrel domain-containing protein n=1 Tax=Capnocytophaga catalasegens TaxID=1004260 RepID=A0AAV5AUV9_9FLAO|nr:porin family protein [Capnocytophaga catalasegens]GIZ15865.1 hypothetical protein RCZ03_18650 [Capnocytophaga catalasegens]GJM49232.1 hypothetical protein RCZ15_02070 [Capnocytophaga catalasegens]GJM53125.1 hypothetical protein RCZ16_14420 [Capnocytophaga catalasegens]